MKILIKKETFFAIMRNSNTTNIELATVLCEIKNINPEFIEELKNNNISNEVLLEEIVELCEDIKFIDILTDANNDTIVISIEDECIIESSNTYSFAISEVIKLIAHNMKVIKAIVIPKVKSFIDKWIQ